MARTARWVDADSLIANCTVSHTTGCWTWPEANMPTPQLSPASPLSKLMGTNSVARILFCICRYPPLCRRLVRWCTSEFCVNPYHHTESVAILRKRKEINRLGLPPDTVFKTSISRDIYPSDEILRTLLVREPENIKALTESASRAGHDARGVESRFDPKSTKIPIAKASHRNIKIKISRVIPEKAPPPVEDPEFAGMDINQIFNHIHKKKLRKLVDEWDD